MGIRIRKMMGYGLTDVVENDPRLNHSSPLFEYTLDNRGTLERYFAWLEERGEFDVAKSLYRDPSKQGAFDISKCFAWGTEDGGLENVFCVRPLAWDDWYRFDDSIDYAEHTYFQNEQSDSVQVTNRALYPHDSYMDSRTGERIKSRDKVDIYVWLRARNSDQDYGLEALDELARLGGFEDNADAEAHCVPHVPEAVRWLCEFAQVFTDPETVIQLRPMIYTWWA